MLKRIGNCALALIILLSCVAGNVSAIENDQSGCVIIDEERHNQIEMLMEQRAELAVDFEKNEIEIEKIDIRLAELGVETISGTEMAEKMGGTANTRAIPIAEKYIEYKSERLITVWNGERYEIQIITCVPTSKLSDLCPDDSFYVKSEGEQIADNITFAATLVTGPIAAVDKVGLSAVVNKISMAFTAYDILHSAYDAMTKTSVLKDVDIIGKICLAVQEKYTFVKCEGSLDEGHQILACVTNHVEYVATVLNEGDLEIDGDAVKPSVNNSSYSGSFTSQYYDYSIQRAAQVYWEYRHYGTTDFVSHFLVLNMEFDWLGDDKTKFSVPYNGLSWTY